MTTSDRCMDAPADPAGRREGSYFVATYPPFSTWDGVGAERFRRALAEAGVAGAARPIGLYVHVPFCEKRCDYCYYLSYEGRLRHGDDYVGALLREMALYAAAPALAERRVDFVYFGGGTPSVLSPARLERLLGGMQEVWSWRGAREVSFECAPRSVSHDKLAVLKAHGVDRISLGVQEMNDAVLTLSGRVHDVAHVERAYRAIRTAGFERVNLDLIAGLAGQTDDSFLAGLDRVIALGPESVTIYQLEIPQNTPLWAALREGRPRAEPASWAAQRSRLLSGFARLEEAGFTVTSGYMAERDPTGHRFLYQDEQYAGADLLGLGASSFSHLAGVQQQNLASLDGYLASLARDALPLWRGCAMSGDERLVREFVLQLKLGRVELRPLAEKFGVDPRDRFAAPLRNAEGEGLLRVEADRVVLTRQGLVRVDHLIPDFYLPEHRGIRYS